MMRTNCKTTVALANKISVLWHCVLLRFKNKHANIVEPCFLFFCFSCSSGTLENLSLDCDALTFYSETLIFNTMSPTFTDQIVIQGEIVEIMSALINESLCIVAELS